MITAIVLSLALCATPKFEWHDCTSTDQIALFQDDVQVGLFVYSKGEYYPLVDGKLLAPCTCPVDVPVNKRAVVENHGINLDKIDGSKKRYLKNGKECSREEALDFMTQVPDDRSWLRLTVIGPDASRTQVLADLKSHAALAPWKGKIVVQDYAPDHWAVNGMGFYTAGSPTIYLQMPSGKVLHRQDAYAGPEDLAAALRKADPNYKPDADPNVNNPNPVLPSLPVDWKKYLPYLLAAAGVALLLWSNKK